MELENRETSNVLGYTENSKPPRPIPPAVCKCGCGHSFQPRRKDQIYINKQHADYGYNHNKRMLKNWRRKKAEKILSHNDNILKKYFKAYKQGDCATCFLKDLKEDGFDLPKKQVNLPSGPIKIFKDDYIATISLHTDVLVTVPIKLIKITKSPEETPESTEVELDTDTSS